MREIQNIQASKGKLIIKPEENNIQKTEGGILLADEKNSVNALLGTVVQSWEGNEHGLVAGDSVYFSRYGYDQINVKGNTYYIVSEASILAKF